MTDDDQARTPPWVSVLAEISRASGHELRNALNALVVNIEVVRSRESDPAVQHFVNQSVEQSEESVRLAESVVALLALVVGAIGANGVVNCEIVSDGRLRIVPERAEIERTVRALRGLADRGALGVDASDTAVILTIPSKRPEN